MIILQLAHSIGFMSGKGRGVAVKRPRKDSLTPLLKWDIIYRERLTQGLWKGFFFLTCSLQKSEKGTAQSSGLCNSCFHLPSQFSAVPFWSWSGLSWWGEGRDTLLFQKTEVIWVELFKHSSQTLAPAGESEHSLVYPEAVPVVWENMMGNESLGSLPQGQLVQGWLRNWTWVSWVSLNKTTCFWGGFRVCFVFLLLAVVRLALGILGRIPDGHWTS